MKGDFKMNRRLIAIGTAVFLFFAAVTFLHGADVDLAWDSPSEGGAVEGYKIYWKEAGGSYNDTDSMRVNGATSGTVSGLDESNTYYFIVEAYNAAGFSPPSNEVVCSYSDTTPPNPPQDVSVY